MQRRPTPGRAQPRLEGRASLVVRHSPRRTKLDRITATARTELVKTGVDSSALTSNLLNGPGPKYRDLLPRCHQ